MHPLCLLSGMAFLYIHLVVVILGPEKLRPQAYSVLVLGPSSLDLTPSQDGIMGDSETQVFCESLNPLEWLLWLPFFPTWLLIMGY